MILTPIKYKNSLFAATLLLFVATACSTSERAVSFEDMSAASISADSLISRIPDYSHDLNTVSGSGRALVSQPGGSERVTVEFYSDRNKSLLKVRGTGGIEGGQILADRDSVLIYNRVDNYAEKVSTAQSSGSSVGSIASVNIVELFNYTFSSDDVADIYEDDRYYAVLLTNSATVLISKEEGWIREADQSAVGDRLGYSRIIYEGYAQIEGFHLPRKITIFSSDGQSRATFLVQQLDVNGLLPPLEIDLPEDIPVYRQK